MTLKIFGGRDDANGKVDDAANKGGEAGDGGDEGAKVSPLCVSCGAQVGEAKFCPECRTPVERACADCASCGHHIEGSPKFCPECGAELQPAL